MNFLVVFPIIATAMAASIPHEGYSTTHVPSLNQGFRVAADGRQMDDLLWVDTAIGQLLALPLSMTIDALNIKIQMLECVFNPTACPFSDSSSSSISVLANALANTGPQISANSDPNQKKYFDGSFTGAVNPNNQRNQFPVAVPAYWSPYLNVAGQKEGLNVNRPYVGSFMPYNGVYPSFINTATQQAKEGVPASTVLDTTAY